jgi:hypothetical protein
MRLARNSRKRVDPSFEKDFRRHLTPNPLIACDLACFT